MVLCFENENENENGRIPEARGPTVKAKQILPEGSFLPEVFFRVQINNNNNNNNGEGVRVRVRVRVTGLGLGFGFG